MNHETWNFLTNLDSCEKCLLSSAIEISGMPDITIAENCLKLIRTLTFIVGKDDYLSFMKWNIGNSKENSIDKLEDEYLTSLINTIIAGNIDVKTEKLKLAFNILDIFGLVWNDFFL